MTQKTLYLFTRTPLHVGAGNSVGAIDQPIQRERHTGFPIIPGSSLKGVFSSFHFDGKGNRDEKARRIFGNDSKSEEALPGGVSISEAQILAFPVRSARGSFAFVTCPLALERLKRVCPQAKDLQPPAEPGDTECRAGDRVGLPMGKPEGVVLEEYRFKISGTFPAEWEALLLGLLPGDPVWQTGKGRFVLLGTGDFSHFVRTACEVAQHVAIDPAKGTAKKGALFNLEAVPSETFFFATLTKTRTELKGDPDPLKELEDFLSGKPVLQFGGDSTTGLGFCTVKVA